MLAKCHPIFSEILRSLYKTYFRRVVVESPHCFPLHCPKMHFSLAAVAILAAGALASPFSPLGPSSFGPNAPTGTKDRRADTWGGSVSLGPTKSTITKAVTTLIPGPAPPTQNGELFLWPGSE